MCPPCVQSTMWTVPIQIQAMWKVMIAESKIFKRLCKLEVRGQLIAYWRPMYFLVSHLQASYAPVWVGQSCSHCIIDHAFCMYVCLHACLRSHLR